MGSMSDVVIRAKGLGKRYRIGRLEAPYKTLRESVTAMALAPARKLRALARGEPWRREPETIWALKDVDLEVRQGEVLGIIGRNGAGKSTLLKILARITEPTAGRVELRGRVGSLLEVGTGFHPELTGRENIYLNGAILGMRKAEIDRRFDEIVAFAEIDRFLDTPVKRYSSGMYVRLAFAVAAHMEPEILLVDEVLAVGDAAFQKKCLGKMGEVAIDGRTVLFVTHNMAAAQQLCPTGILLCGGAITVCGDIGAVVGGYLQSSERLLVDECDASEIFRRPGEGVRFRFLRIALGGARAILPMWTPIEFDLDFECSEPLHGIVLGVSVLRPDGGVVFSAESEDAGVLLHLEGGQHRSMKVTIPTPNLAPGRYSLRVGARSGGRVVDWIDRVLTFDVEHTAGSLIAAQPHLGMRPQSVWEPAHPRPVRSAAHSTEGSDSR